MLAFLIYHLYIRKLDLMLLVRLLLKRTYSLFCIRNTGGRFSLNRWEIQSPPTSVTAEYLLYRFVVCIAHNLSNMEGAKEKGGGSWLEKRRHSLSDEGVVIWDHTAGEAASPWLKGIGIWDHRLKLGLTDFALCDTESFFFHSHNNIWWVLNEGDRQQIGMCTAPKIRFGSDAAESRGKKPVPWDLVPSLLRMSWSWGA